MALQCEWCGGDLLAVYTRDRISNNERVRVRRRRCRVCHAEVETVERVEIHIKRTTPAK